MQADTRHSAQAASPGTAAEAAVRHDIEWDAGELGCGDLVLALRQQVRAHPGKVFCITALDAGAPADLPAWCRMTGHALLAHEPATHRFWVRAKG